MMVKIGGGICDTFEIKSQRNSTKKTVTGVALKRYDVEELWWNGDGTAGLAVNLHFYLTLVIFQTCHYSKQNDMCQVKIRNNFIRKKNCVRWFKNIKQKFKFRIWKCQFPIYIRFNFGSAASCTSYSLLKHNLLSILYSFL